MEAGSQQEYELIGQAYSIDVISYCVDRKPADRLG